MQVSPRASPKPLLVAAAGAGDQVSPAACKPDDRKKPDDEVCFLLWTLFMAAFNVAGVQTLVFLLTWSTTYDHQR